MTLLESNSNHERKIISQVLRTYHLHRNKYQAPAKHHKYQVARTIIQLEFIVLCNLQVPEITKSLILMRLQMRQIQERRNKSHYRKSQSPLSRFVSENMLLTNRDAKEVSKRFSKQYIIGNSQGVEKQLSQPSTIKMQNTTNFSSQLQNGVFITQDSRKSQNCQMEKKSPSPMVKQKEVSEPINMNNIQNSRNTQLKILESSRNRSIKRQREPNLVSSSLPTQKSISPFQQELECIKITHKSEIIDLKRKLADSERRLVQIWEHIKEQNRRSDQKLNDFQQLVLQIINQQCSNNNNLNINLGYNSATNLNNNQLSSILQIQDQSIDQNSKVNLVGLLQQKASMDSGQNILDTFNNGECNNNQNEVKKRPGINCTFLKPSESLDHQNQMVLNQQMQDQQESDFINQKQMQQQYSELSSSLISQYETNQVKTKIINTNQIQQEIPFNQNDRYSTSVFGTSDLVQRPSIPYLEIEEEIQAMMGNSKEIMKLQQSIPSQKQLVTFENGSQFRVTEQVQNLYDEEEEEQNDSNLYSISNTTCYVRNRSKVPLVSATQNLLQDWKSNIDQVFSEINQQRQLREQKRNQQTQPPTPIQDFHTMHEMQQMQYRQLRQNNGRVQSQNYNNIGNGYGMLERKENSSQSSSYIKFEDPDTVSKLRQLTKEICKSDSKVPSFHSQSNNELKSFSNKKDRDSFVQMKQKMKKIEPLNSRNPHQNYNKNIKSTINKSKMISNNQSKENLNNDSRVSSLMDSDKIKIYESVAAEKLAVLESITGQKLNQNLHNQVQELLQQSIQSQLGCKNGRQDLVLNLDYFLINEETWQIFKQNYDADYQIMIYDNRLYIQPISNQVEVEIVSSNQYNSKSSLMEIPNEYSSFKQINGQIQKTMPQIERDSENQSDLIRYQITEQDEDEEVIFVEGGNKLSNYQRSLVKSIANQNNNRVLETNQQLSNNASSINSKASNNNILKYLNKKSNTTQSQNSIVPVPSAKSKLNNELKSITQLKNQTLESSPYGFLNNSKTQERIVIQNQISKEISSLASAYSLEQSYKYRISSDHSSSFNQ
ncbi:UNKNOWN [Stylonychia lemnae]|uniref:Uncharacterized protein n=1 Tax=Stylonychia lemnae TaxID=5949 RepID=A0A078B7X9_STYLE|nr:UNKNOWN [Stylonychia lemnae]|eukprot:CDW90630.1 UNKNOWN [Stylonychia lemnae]